MTNIPKAHLISELEMILSIDRSIVKLPSIYSSIQKLSSKGRISFAWRSYHGYKVA